MLAKHHRLKRSQDFQAAWQRGDHYRGRLLSLNVLANHLPHSRFGFVVSSKVGNAVTRNRIKRRLREIVRTQLSVLANGYDVVIIAHRPTAQADYHALESRLGDLFQQAGLKVSI